MIFGGVVFLDVSACSENCLQARGMFLGTFETRRVVSGRRFLGQGCFETWFSIVFGVAPFAGSHIHNGSGGGGGGWW